MTNDPWANLKNLTPENFKPEDLAKPIIEPPSSPVNLPEDKDNG